MPEVEAGMYLIDLLFKVGPIRGEMPLVEADLEPWERRRGIELAPWQADLLLDMSQEYLKHVHLGREMSALSPWTYAQKMWMHVTAKKHEKQVQQKEKEPDGNRKRRRNPAAG